MTRRDPAVTAVKPARTINQLIAIFRDVIEKPAKGDK